VTVDQIPLFADAGDADARDAIRTRLNDTLFVEAGAGTGKTAALVGRVLALVTTDGPGLPIPMRSIAAITFTEKAAAELRGRIRAELEARVRSEEHPVVRDRCRAALDELDAAAISTLHSFAQRILTDLPIEAGLPPRVQVRDEIASLVAFDERWRLFRDELLEDPAMETSILVLLAAGSRLEHLRVVAEVFDDNWDLLDRVGAPPELAPLDVDGWLAALGAVCDRAAECRFGEDRLAERLGELREYAARVRGAFDDVERIRLLRADKPSFRVSQCGRKDNWPNVNSVRDEVMRLGEQRSALVNRVLDTAIRRLAAAIARHTAAMVAERRAAGELEFHDLLVLTRSLLRDSRHGARARERLRERYQRILVDEFQDTDPIQVEIAALLASADPSAGERPWTDVEVDPGRLFFVGDPKQSIYRFRRADIATFLTAAEKFGGSTPVTLTCNFRSAPPVLEWVNHVFDELIQPFPGSQPEYRALEAARADDDGTGPAVTLLGAEPHIDAAKAETLREREAIDVAGAIQTAIAHRWQVCDPRNGQWHDARLGDICVLLPARTSLPYLERALDDARIPYRAETSSLVYATREIRDLLAALRAIDDPSDELSLVGALRSALFGCGDDDLYTYHVEHRGQWDLGRAIPASVPESHPVAIALRYLRARHDERMWQTPSQLLERLVRDRAVLEAGALEGRFRDVARRVRFLVDQARAFQEAAGGRLRDYLAWAELQGAEGARVVETVLPETDDDAVRIMTVHGAKGLEFPIVVCSGMTTQAQNRRGGVQVLFPPTGGCDIRLARDVQTEEFELHRPIDEQMSFHEKLRLLYVAATRARDHLVVSVHRVDRELKPDPQMWTHAELVWNAAQGASWEPLTAPFGIAAPAPLDDAELGDERLDPELWELERAQAFAHGRRRSSIAATALAHPDGRPGAPLDPGLAKDGRDLELPPWNKGRYGTAIGRAVHGVLQVVDLASGDGLDAAVAAQAAAEGVLGHEPVIRALAAAALGSAHVARACTRPRWRELFVAVPIDGITLEGYVDLLYRDDDGLVVVDYKTDAVRDVDTLEARLVHYRVQTAAYAVAVEAVTGERVVRCVLCFLDPEGARDVVVEGEELAAAVAEARARVHEEEVRPSPLPPAVLADA
jgi:ATP-dependent exoDNAse (exonuclease V) beta subunit